ncbi:DUF2927 domain-containing protein [Maribacter sp.]|nr:DUF2927 domain-containing protein [Maribacter sp.]
MKKIVLAFLSLLVLSCSTDADETLEEIINEANANNAPAVVSQQFQIAEHSSSGTSIGIVAASDVENDALTYTIDAAVDILINETTGELTTGENLQLDFEAQEEIALTVSVFDGKAITDADITVTIVDINEFDALSQSQKEVVAHFKHLTLFQDTTSPTQEIMRKWDAPMKLFLDGTISQSFRTTVETVIAEYNALTATGSFNIALVDTEMESNAKLYFGAKEDIETIFPEMYAEIKDLSFDGYSRASFAGDFYRTGQIWVSSSIDVLFKHELGHAMGMGHSHLCDAPNPSVMCASIAQDSTFLEIEEEVIKFFYHAAMPSGISAEEIEATLANLLLLED